MAPAQLWPWKLLLLGAEALMVVTVSSRLSARGFLLMCWCPLAVYETSFNAHPDVLGVALLALSMEARQRWVAALWCGLAVGAKALILPLCPFLFLANRRAWAVWAGTIALLYVHLGMQGSSAEWVRLEVGQF